MNINTIINNLNIETCPYERGTTEYMNYTFNLSNNVDAIKYNAKYSEYINNGITSFVIHRYADILTGIDLKFKKCIGSDEILHTFQEKNIEFNEPLITLAFPRDNTQPISCIISDNDIPEVFDFWELAIEFDSPLSDSYIVDVTTTWIEPIYNHPVRYKLKDREFISEYYEYTPTKITNIN